MILDQSTIGKAVCNGNNAKKERTSGSDIYPTHKLCDRGRSGGGPRTEGQGKHKLSSCQKVKISKYCCLTKCQSEHYLLLWCFGQWNQCGLKFISHRIKLYFYSALQQKDCGLLTLTIHYKTHIAHNESSTAAHRNIGQSQVCLTVGILKACGLKVSIKCFHYNIHVLVFPIYTHNYPRSAVYSYM